MCEDFELVPSCSLAHIAASGIFYGSNFLIVTPREGTKRNFGGMKRELVLYIRLHSGSERAWGQPLPVKADGAQVLISTSERSSEDKGRV